MKLEIEPKEDKSICKVEQTFDIFEVKPKTEFEEKIGIQRGMTEFESVFVKEPKAEPKRKKRKRLKKSMKDPKAPKKPLSAYFLFLQNERPKVKAQFPNYSVTEIVKAGINIHTKIFDLQKLSFLSHRRLGGF